MEQILVLIGIALILGFVSSFLGIGGGSIAVPVLYSAFPNATPLEVISVSLGSIFLISNLNLIQYAKHNVLPPRKQIPLMACACLAGGLLGSKLVIGLDPVYIKKLFGFMLVIITLKTILKKEKLSQTLENDSVSNEEITLISFFGSLLSSLTGLGGGIIFTPAFLEISKLKVRKVAPYANLGMVFATGFGITPHLLTTSQNASGIDVPGLNFLQVGNVNLSVVVFLAAGSLISSPLGVKLNQRVSKANKKRVLVIILIILAVKTILS